MGILAKSCGLSQYTTGSDLPSDFLNVVVDRVRYRAFIDIEQDSVTEKSIGWVDIDNMLDAQFETINFLKEPYIVLGMRVDKRAVPASVLKRNCLIKEQQIMQDEGISFINGKRRKEIKEAVRQSLLSSMIPTTQVYDMVWKYTTGHVLFTNTSPKLCDDFQELFSATFNLRLNTIELSLLGSAILHANKKPKKVIEDFKYVEIPGSDFLAWLWDRCLEDNNEFKIADGTARLLFDDKVVLNHEDIDTPQTVTCVGDSQSMSEIQTALNDNKLIVQAKLILTTMDGDWSFFLDAFYFDFKSIKTPKVKTGKGDDPDSIFYDKIALIEKTINTLNTIYGEFVLECTAKGDN
jgi:hypothetical protein